MLWSHRACSNRASPVNQIIWTRKGSMCRLHFPSRRNHGRWCDLGGGHAEYLIAAATAYRRVLHRPGGRPFWMKLLALRVQPLTLPSPPMGAQWGRGLRRVARQSGSLTRSWVRGLLAPLTALVNRPCFLLGAARDDAISTGRAHSRPRLLRRARNDSMAGRAAPAGRQLAMTAFV
jgi:hypothetical protein